MGGARVLMEQLHERFDKARVLGEGALDQLEPADWHFAPGTESTSIAVIVKHLHGNMLSRWTDFLTSDGNKSWRQRDAEFETDGTEPPAQIRAWWDAGWTLTLDTLASLDDADLAREVTIRQMPLTVFDAILRQHGHYNYHIGQIVYLARQCRGEHWQTLSIAKGASAQYKAKPGD
ncbi:MAG: DUF1572 domain-containing protein [Candidatus Hydrogenedens sp.]|nr:DUF1572 domain-containing protein [Candidatus Hydrogenedens sp.]